MKILTDTSDFLSLEIKYDKNLLSEQYYNKIFIFLAKKQFFQLYSLFFNFFCVSKLMIFTLSNNILFLMQESLKYFFLESTNLGLFKTKKDLFLCTYKTVMNFLMQQ